MELVKITLNTDKQSLFMLPGKLHLTFEEPGPIEIDPSSLSDEEKAWINQAHSQQILLVDNPNPKEVKEAKANEKPTIETQGSISSTVQVAEEPSTLSMGSLEENRQRTKERAQELASLKITKLRKEIKDIDDILILRSIREIEAEQEKPRKGVLALVGERIGQIQSNVLANIGGDTGEELGQFYAGQYRNLRNLPQVEETSERTIAFKPLSEEDS